MRKDQVLTCIIFAVLAFGFGEAVFKSWTCDDAYIHFRYAENLALGKGLVYNAGERVEGYLTVGWNLILAGGIRCGLDPLLFANIFGLLCFAGTIALLLRSARHLPLRDGKVLPLAAAALAWHGHSQIFATSGMETSLFTFLVTAMALHLISARTPAQYMLNGGLGVLVTLTRMDGALFCVGAFVVVLLAARHQRSWWPVLLFCLPTLVIYLPYFFWRWDYYGWLFPNLYYTKSAGRAYPDQGLFYVWIFLKCYYVMIVALLGLLWFGLRRCRMPIHEPGWHGLRAPATLSLFVFPYMAYVIWVGGDFMFGRFLIPISALILIGLQFLLQNARSRRVGLVFSATVLVCMKLPIYPELIKTLKGYRGVGDEPLFYKTHALAMGAAGRALAEHTKDTDTRVMIGAGQAALGYFGRFPTVIERNGLTDEYIAHLPLKERGRVAHERAELVPMSYYTQVRKVNFYFDLEPGPFVELPGAIGKARQIGFKLTGHEDNPAYPEIKGYIVTYDNELMDTLAQRTGIEFIPFGEVLDRYLARIPSGEISKEQLRGDYAEFKEFYFDHNDDRRRQAAFEAAMR